MAKFSFGETFLSSYHRTIIVAGAGEAICCLSFASPLRFVAAPRSRGSRGLSVSRDPRSERLQYVYTLGPILIKFE